jgi:hypothetical protein
MTHVHAATRTRRCDDHTFRLRPWGRPILVGVTATPFAFGLWERKRCAPDALIGDVTATSTSEAPDVRYIAV